MGTIILITHTSKGKRHDAAKSLGMDAYLCSPNEKNIVISLEALQKEIKLPLQKMKQNRKDLEFYPISKVMKKLLKINNDVAILQRLKRKIGITIFIVVNIDVNQVWFSKIAFLFWDYTEKSD